MRIREAGEQLRSFAEQLLGEVGALLCVRRREIADRSEFERQASDLVQLTKALDVALAHHAGSEDCEFQHDCEFGPARIQIEYPSPVRYCALISAL